MRKFAILTVFCFFVAYFAIFQRTAEGDSPARSNDAVAAALPVHQKATRFAESAQVSDLGKTLPKRRSPDSNLWAASAGFNFDSSSQATSESPDGSDGAVAPFGESVMPPPSLSFDGLSNYDNINAYDLLIIPPDMNGDVGPGHYVQIVNSLFRVYSKSGVPLTSPTKISDLFAPLNSPCSARNDGLPNVLYDPLADRWLVSQVCSNFPPFRQLVAVSKTGDPAGAYFLYEFVMPNVRINDFPKFGVWPDAFYISTDEFLGSDYVGSGAFAFDREKMLVGDASASYIYFNLPVADMLRRGGLLPADLDGLRPPAAGTPGTFASYTATEYGDANDALRLFDFHADFADPSASTFRERAESPITVAAFDPTSPPGRQDITQPAPGEFLDSVSDRLNHRLAYRNFGDYESLTVNQTVRTSSASGPYRAGVRVYELRRSGGGYAPHVQSTVGDALASRWIGAVAQDHQGNIAVGYNHASEARKPSILYSGRLVSDPAGVFRTEATLVTGTGVQKAFGWRWGEYSGMVVDPVDDCTFWMTNGYYTLESETFSDFTWLTRIGRFKYSECTPAPRAVISGTVINSASGLPIDGAKITAASYTRRTSATGSYGPMMVLPGTYQLTATARGFRTQTFAVTVSDAQTLERSFALEPVAVLVATGTEIASESCRINNAAEPGETLSINISLRNEGLLATQDLRATLLSSAGVIDPGPPQSYGSLPPNGPSVTRSFTFTVSPSTPCGSVIVLRLRLDDSPQTLGEIAVNLQTGELRVAYSENFDSSRGSPLPRFWTTSFSQAHQPWRLSETRSQSPPYAPFSPAPHQLGVNEVTSPPFNVLSPVAEVSFRNWYSLETTFLRNRLYDGSVFEVKIGGGEWRDILAAGGTFVSGGYDGAIDKCCGNPLAGRLGWSGRSGLGEVSEFITSRAKLPAAAAGNVVQLRFRIGTDIGGGREGQYIDDLVVRDGYSCGCSAAADRAKFDFDGDGRTDISVYDLSDAAAVSDFRYVESLTGTVRAVSWGSVGDAPAAADFDGDGKTDIAVFRPASGTWYVIKSSDGTFAVTNFGTAGDIVVPADFDGDRRADISVFRPSNGVWYITQSTNGSVPIQQFGSAGDRPVAEDYDGDGKADIAVFRPTSGVWYGIRSTNSSIFATPFGQNGDVPVVGDFDGDSRADTAVYRPSEGIWYIDRTSLGFSAVRFGAAGDKPLQADIDGDGESDTAVFRPATRTWYFINSGDGSVGSRQFGEPGERPLPAIYTSPE